MTNNNTQKYSIEEVANVFISIQPMSPKKLQKLLYYMYAWYLANYNNELFDNSFQGWIHGPVAPTIYHKYKYVGWYDIPVTENESRMFAEFREKNQHLSELVEKLVETYGHLDADQLEYLTHQEKPWIESREGLSPIEAGYVEIKKETIYSYFRGIIEREQRE